MVADALRSVLDALPHGVTLIDAQGRLVHGNATFWAFIGVDPSVCPPGTPMETMARLFAYRGLYGPGDPEAQAAAVLALDRSRPTHRHLRSADGAQVRELITVPLPDGGMLSCAHDITRLVQAEAEAESRARLVETVLGSLHTGVIAFDAKQRVTLANPAADSLSGLPPGTVRPGRELEYLTSLQIQRGEFANLDPAEELAKRKGRDRSLHFVRVRERPSGDVLQVASHPLQDGGFVIEMDNITALKRAEDEAKRRAALIAGVLDALPHGVCVYGADRRLAMFNEAYQRIMDGAPLALGDHVDDIIVRRIASGEFDAAYGAESSARSLNAVKEPDQRVRRRPNGTVIAIRSAPLPDGGHISVVTDVTALHRAEETARERAGMLDAILEALPDGVVVYGPDGRARMTNPAYRRILGDAGARHGESLDDLLERRVASGELSRERAELVKRSHFGPAAEDGASFRRLRPNGIAVVSRSSRLPDGGNVAVITDITPLHKAEQELRRRAAMQEAMLATIRQGIILYGPDRRVLAANRKTHEMTGMPVDEPLVGRSLSDLIDGQVRRGEVTAERAVELKSMDRTRPHHYVRKRLDGMMVDIVSEPTPDGGFVITYSDVTEDRQIRAELERARAAAEAASEAKSRFLATMSHELRTPLHAVIGFSEAIAAEQDRARIAEYAAAVNEAGRHLLQLVDDILDVARSQTGALHAAEEPFDLELVLRDALQGAMPAISAGRLEAALRLSDRLPWLRGDAGRLRQVLDKLLSNAVKFTPPGGRITLSAEADDHVLTIRVSDTGIGVPPEHRARMFEPFTQLDSSLSRRFQGSGLGLHLARTLALALGATLALEDAEGPGIVAALRFPASRLTAPLPTGLPA